MQVAREFRPDAIVLDIMLPDIDGLEVLQRVRADGTETPVLFLTAKDSLDDRIAGLTAGGDDYVTKPFSLEEVVARLRGLIRRSTLDARAGEGPGARRRRPLAQRGLATRWSAPATPIELTATEFELLRFLMRNPRRVLSKAQILDRVWNYDFGGKESSSSSTSPTCARRSTPAATPMIHTVRGAGYMLKAVG